jgi:hypothetical protein
LGHPNIRFTKLFRVSSTIRHGEIFILSSRVERTNSENCSLRKLARLSRQVEIWNVVVFGSNWLPLNRNTSHYRDVFSYFVLDRSKIIDSGVLESLRKLIWERREECKIQDEVTLIS